MKLKNMSKEDLEALSYSELAEMILTEKKSKMKIVDIFKEICKLLELSDSVFENQVADFFQLVSTDKNFIVLDKGYCDLRKKHAPKVTIEEVEDDGIDTEELEEEDTIVEEDSENSDEDIFYDASSDEDDVDTDDDDDLDDFMVVDDETDTETSL
jgi:DNA-directed RNA polymerase subunit delta